MIGAPTKTIINKYIPPFLKRTGAFSFLLTRYLRVYHQVMVQPSAPSFDDLASSPPPLRPCRPLQIASQLGRRTAQSNGRLNPSITT